jgi:hypothetical protein
MLGYTPSNYVYDVSSVLITATRNFGTSVLTTTARYAPVASEVATFALRAGLTGGLLYVAYEFGGQYVNYLLDSTGLHYTPTDTKKYQYYSTCFGSNSVCNTSTGTTVKFYSIGEIQSSFQTAKTKDSYSSPVCTVLNSNFDINSAPARCIGANAYNVGWTMTTNPSYVPNAPAPTPVTVPVETLGQKAIDLAISGNSTAKSVIVDTVKDIEAQPTLYPIGTNVIVDQYNNNIATPTNTVNTNASVVASSVTTNSSGVTTETTKTNSNISFSFPVFCNWAGFVCESFKWFTGNTDFTPNTEKPTEKDINVNAVYSSANFSFGSTCPAPYYSPIDFGQVHTSMKFDYANICSAASQLKYVFKLIAYFMAFSILIPRS